MTNQTNNYIFEIKSLWFFFSKSRKIQYVGLIFFMVISAFLEVVSIGAIIPFIAILIEPTRLLDYSLGNNLFIYLGNPDESKLVLFMTMAFTITAVFSSLFRMYLVYINTKIAYGSASDLAVILYKTTLNKPYKLHLSTNSSVVVSAISDKVNEVAIGVLQAIPTLISSIILLISIIVGLLFINPFITINLALFFTIIYFFINLFFKRKLTQHSQEIAIGRANLINHIHDGLGGIREILLHKLQPMFIEIFSKTNKPLRNAAGSNYFISSSPRYFIEALGIILIALVTIYLSKQPGGLSSGLPLLGVMVMATQKMLPIFQQIYSSWVAIKTSESSLKIILKLLSESDSAEDLFNKNKNIRFKEKFEMININFSYDKDKPKILNNLNICIKKGQIIGLIGKSGSGKSTFIDVLIGFLKPSSGLIKVDNIAIDQRNIKSWQGFISHVSQNVFILDDTVYKNIAFGIPDNEIDIKRVKWAAKLACADEFIKLMDNGYYSKLGDNGVSISGGQRQRIAIARALYNKSNFIIFDEATSSLDELTELKVIRSIRKISKNTTIIMISHKLSLLKFCDSIYQIKNGSVSFLSKLDFKKFSIKNLK